MTKWKAPDGRIFDDGKDDMYEVASQYFSEDDFENEINDLYGSSDGTIEIIGITFFPSDIVRQMDPVGFDVAYGNELFYKAEEPESMGFERISESSKPTPKKPVSKASKPRAKAPASSSKPKSKGVRR